MLLKGMCIPILFGILYIFTPRHISRSTTSPGSLTKLRAPEGSTSQCQPGGAQSRTLPSGLINRDIVKAGAEEEERVEERRWRVEEGDGLARTGDEVVCIYAQAGTS